MADVPRGSAGAGHLISETERAGPQKTVVSCPEQVTSDTKEILYDPVHRCEALQMGGRLEPAHLPLPLADWLMRDLCSIVLVLPRTVDDGRHHWTVRRRVTAQLVRDQAARLAALSLQELAEEPCGRLPIAPRLHEDVEDISILVHRATRGLNLTTPAGRPEVRGRSGLWTLRDTMVGVTSTYRASGEPSVRDLAHGRRSL